jgi:hypothetical protein
LDFLAEVTQHIPNKGEHPVRYYSWYSNKKRGLHQKTGVAVNSPQAESDTAFLRKCRLTWAALIIFFMNAVDGEETKAEKRAGNYGVCKAILFKS